VSRAVGGGAMAPEPWRSASLRNSVSVQLKPSSNEKCPSVSQSTSKPTGVTSQNFRSVNLYVTTVRNAMALCIGFHRELSTYVLNSML
jgi:hypothetical protein